MTALQTAPIAPVSQTEAPDPNTQAPTPEEDALRASLLDTFEKVHDPRSRFGRQYPLPAVLALVVTASLCGAKNPTQIYVFGKRQPRLLRQLGFRPPGKPKHKPDRQIVRSPNEDTLVYVLGLIDPNQFVQAFSDWVSRMIGSTGACAAAVDGKALRGSEHHVLTVFVGDLRLAAWQEGVPAKENEFSAFVRALDTLFARYPGLRLLTGDAMFCQKEIARKIVLARRDYLLQLKAPHTTDQAIAQEAFAQIVALGPALARSEAEKRGGRAGACS